MNTTRPGSPEANAMIDSVLAEYGWPTNPKNAARAGFIACQRLATPRASTEESTGVPPVDASQGEREAFRTSMARLYPSWSFAGDGCGGYHAHYTEAAWQAWKARAALSSTPATVPQVDIEGRRVAAETENQACAAAVWMTRMDAEMPDADDLGVSGWLQEAETRIRRRLTSACLDCGGSGMRDSGGVTPWGENIFIACDCGAATPNPPTATVQADREDAELPTNLLNVLRRIRRCESETAAQVVLEHALHKHAAAHADRDALIQLIADKLSGTYHCNRVWNAWNVGTMSQDDFEDVGESDTPAELADEVLALLTKGAGE